MKSAGWLALCGVAIVTLMGCGSKSGDSTTAGSPQPAVETPGQPERKSTAIVVPPEVTQKVAQLKTPDDVVATFLAAMRDGDEQTISALLSNKAREATGQHEELAIQPPGSPTATYRVGNVELVGDDKSGAHVVSIWSERDFDGSAIEYEVIWVLRQEVAGWRVAGMATMIEENQPPLFLNFEDPEEMLALLSAAQQRRDESAAAYQAENTPPVDPNTQQR